MPANQKRPSGSELPIVSLDARKWGDFGIGSYVRICVEALQLISEKARGRLLVSPGAGGPQAEECPGLERVPVRGSDYGLRQHTSLPRAARGSAWLHCPHYVLPQAWRGPSIVTIHDLIHLRFPQWFGRGARTYARWLIRDAYQRADCILTVSETVKSDLLERFGGSPERVRVIHNEVHPAFYAQGQGEAARNHGSLGQLPHEYALAAGNHKPHKDLSLLIDALADLGRRSLVIPLVLAGGSQTTDLQRRAQELGVTCLTLEHLPVEDLAEVYRGARVLVHPSHYEGFGLPVAEAMASGLPVLAARAGAVPEVGGGAIELFTPGRRAELAERLAQLWQDDQRREALSASGRQRAQAFAPGTAASQLAVIYQQLLESGSEPSQRPRT